MRRALCGLLLFAGTALAQPGPAGEEVRVLQDEKGAKLQVGGRDFLVVGVNWDYIPIGYNYRFNLWEQPDDVIKEALAREMPLLQRMGVNTLRLYVGIPARWVQYLYETYGLYTVLNPVVGRYGFTLEGVWQGSTDYSDPRIRAALKDEVVALVRQYRDVPGILMWLLGNENNYGLTWKSFEIESLPKEERDTQRARFLYSLFGELTAAVKAEDLRHPVAIANGDLQYLDVIAQECKGLDVFGTNVYRGVSARDLFERVKGALGVPVLFTEFGADAYDARRMREDDVAQARYLLAQWAEIYEQSHGKGRVGNAIGGMVFQWSDGWWKYNQESKLDVHDTTASWEADAYPHDHVPGQNNMNEEWWGLCAKGPTDAQGLYELTPRTAYYALQAALRLPPYAATTDLSAIRASFGAVDPTAFAARPHAESALSQLNVLGLARVAGLRMELSTFSTGGTRAATPATQRAFDHLESFYLDVETHPLPQVRGGLSLNVLGNVPTNPIDQLFYERRGRTVALTDAAGAPFTLVDRERVKVYRASLSWEESLFTLTGFYREGHYHWGYEGDFFNLYREAFYGPSIDTYNADVPIGLELTGKRQLDGLKVAFGPQLWWGANPALLVKYQLHLGPVDLTLMDEEQFAPQSAVATSAAIPEQLTRRTTVSAATRIGRLGVELGGIWGGTPRLRRSYLTDSPGLGRQEHLVKATDTLGGKLKVTLELGRLHWYAQAAYMGLVADAGPTQTVTFTGWSLKDSGSGNQTNALTGLAIDLTPFQIAPNLIWQRPVVAPGPSINPDRALRNILDDPFAVRSNREMVGAELLLVYDPTPATWLWAWDNDVQEDAPFAASLDFIYRQHLTSADAAIGILEDGTLFAFPAATPARGLYEVQARLVARPRLDLRILAHLFAGTGEARGDNPRLVNRYGGDVRVTWQKLAVSASLRFNDWGPYDYYRDFNLTFPLQTHLDVSVVLGAPRWLGLAQTRLGVRGTLRYLNGFSPDFVPSPEAPGAWGNEYEVRSYVTIAL